MTEINSWFIGSFKLWDNINFNLEILKKLYWYYKNEKEEEKEFLLKPITILIITIIEALLSDYFHRIYWFVREWINGLSEEKLQEIRNKKYEDFNNYINWSKKHNLFNSDDLFYEELHYLRSIRNNIHINWRKDECFIYTKEWKEQAEKYCKNIMNYLSENHLRDKDKKCVDNFILPW